MYGGEMYTGVWWGNLRERDYLEDRRSWEDNIKMDHQEVRHGLDCPAQGRDRWRA
jgi:hypothetical protein